MMRRCRPDQASRNGTCGGGRTHNLRLRKPTLYPIELRTRRCWFIWKKGAFQASNAAKTKPRTSCMRGLSKMAESPCNTAYSAAVGIGTEPSICTFSLAVTSAWSRISIKCSPAVLIASGSWILRRSNSSSNWLINSSAIT